MGAAPPRPRRAGSAPAAPRPSACRLWGAQPPTAPSRRSTRCARLWPAHPPSEFLSVGAAPPRPRRVGSATAAPRAGACRLWGAAPPTAPSRRSTRCARLWPARPPSEFRSVGAAPPRPRRAGSAPAAPRPSACRLWGAAPPTAPSRRSTRCARLWPAHPPSEFLSVGAAPPRPRRVGSATAAPRPSARRLWGAQPPTPPSRRSTRCARLWPTHPPSEFLSVGAAPPRPRRVGSAIAAPRPSARLCMAAPGTPLDRHRDAASGNAEPRAPVSGARWPSTSTRRNSFCYGYLDAPRRPGDQVARRRTRK